MFALCTEYNSAKNATLDASAAAHIAENEAKEVLLMLTQGKDILSMGRTPYEAPVGTQHRQNMKKRASVKVEGRIKKLPVRISVRTAKQWRFFINFCSISKE